MATTPHDVSLIARLPTGEEVDVTEGVQALYDLVINSMDWGSGFLSYEEALPVAKLAELCGFKDIEEAQRYLRASELEKGGLSSWAARDQARQEIPPSAS
jgi:hypothetical protein